MKFMNLKFVKFASYFVLVVGLCTGAFASCGDTLAAMASGAAHLQSRSIQAGDQAQGGDVQSSPMVGLWHIQFLSLIHI